jgi:AraC-like DNA-binding protein
VKIYIRYMVSLRCKANANEALKDLGISAIIRELGVVELKQVISTDQHKALSISLKRYGLILLDKNHEVLIEKIEQILNQLMSEEEVFSNSSYEQYLTENLGLSFDCLATLFAEVNGCTISHYLLILKIEKVKELILYNELSLKDIAQQLDFKNTVQLSNHFKKVTGLTPSFFKSLRKKRRSLLSKV